MIYVILFLISFSLTYFIKEHAIKNLLVAKITERSSHTAPTPHGGGIAIAITWFLGISYLYYIDGINISLYFALMIGIIISAVSYLDDLYELSVKVRLGVQSLVAVLSLYIIGGFEQFDLFFFIIDNQIITNIVSFFMIVWFINLYNFLDGIDGYAGSEAVFIGVASFFLFGESYFLVLATSVFGFLVWNWRTAKIFMGDVGSTLLGYTIAIFTIYYANQEASNFWVWIILFGLFWFDATLTLYRRYKNGEKLSQAHKKHGYQRLNQSGLSPDKVVLMSIIINLVLFTLVYFIPNKLFAFVMAYIILYSIMKLVDSKKDFL